jgi:hypothetical protein
MSTVKGVGVCPRALFEVLTRVCFMVSLRVGEESEGSLPPLNKELNIRRKVQEASCGQGALVKAASEIWCEAVQSVKKGT